MRPKNTYFEVIIFIDKIKKHPNTYYYFKGKNISFDNDVYGYFDTRGNINFYDLDDSGKPKKSITCNVVDEKRDPLYSELYDDFKEVVITIDNVDILPTSIIEKYVKKTNYLVENA